MVARSIRGLTNEKSDAQAWSSIFASLFILLYGECMAKKKKKKK